MLLRSLIRAALHATILFSSTTSQPCSIRTSARLLPVLAKLPLAYALIHVQLLLTLVLGLGDGSYLASRKQSVVSFRSKRNRAATRNSGVRRSDFV